MNTLHGGINCFKVRPDHNYKLPVCSYDLHFAMVQVKLVETGEEKIDDLHSTS